MKSVYTLSLFFCLAGWIHPADACFLRAKRPPLIFQKRVAWTSLFLPAASQSQDKKTAPQKEPRDLDLKVKSFQTIQVDIPGRGKRTVWFLLYEVTNNTKERHLFIPNLVLVDLEKNKEYQDEVLPLVQETIGRKEDPQGKRKILNSVTISKDPIEPGKTVLGVAMWEGVDPKLGEFSVLVKGLSKNQFLFRLLNFKRTIDPKLPGGEKIELLQAH